MAAPPCSSAKTEGDRDGRRVLTMRSKPSLFAALIALFLIGAASYAQASPSTPIAISLGAVTGGAVCSINVYFSFKS